MRVKTAVDVDNLFGRKLTALEREQLPFAAVQAANATAFAVRERWKSVMPQILDRPKALTLNAVLYRKATKANPTAEVFIRDEAHKGTPPAKYLLAQVEGGSRRLKAFERRLRDVGVLPSGMFVVPGKGAALDQHGNLPAGVITSVLSQLQAQFDPLANESDKSRGRRVRRAAKRGTRGGNYFAVKATRGKLKPGVYERLATGFGSAVRSVMFFVKSVTYRPRYDVFGLAERLYRVEFPFHFTRELEKALTTAKFRGRA